MSLMAWSWAFLVVYLGAMIALGVVGQRRVRGADDFAVARGAYGPVFLAFATAATISSGATFMGSPGIAYDVGVASLWAVVLAPIGAYAGLVLSMKLLATAGPRFGNRSIPEFLGDRYRSEGMRVAVSLFSLLLLFYLAGQLVAGVVVFELLLGLSPLQSLLLTTAVLLVYVTLGGAHADILTDGVQGFLMLLIAILVAAMFFAGAGVEGGLGGLLARLEAQDLDLVQPLNPDNPLFRSWWSVAALVIAHVPLGLLPHIGNKLWALSNQRARAQFVGLTMFFFILLALLGTGGLMARGILGDALHAEGSSPNQSLPALFIELFPSWLTAFLGVGILAAVMSTADGLVVSSSQIFANDLYRRTFARRGAPPSEEVIERRVLQISRYGTVAVLVLCAAMAWWLRDMNVTLLVWIGNGGLLAGLMGPLVLGSLWRGVTRAGAAAGLLTGVGAFALLHSGALDPRWFEAVGLQGVVSWLDGEAPNPFSCAALAQIASVIVTVAVSLVTPPLPREHLAELFAGDAP